MVAALPMYLPPRAAVESFWQALAQLLRERTGATVPATLTWPGDYHAHWENDVFLISQTCGYPLTTALFDKVQVLGAFAYDAQGADGVNCRSQLICRSTERRNTLADFKGSTLAFNSTDSQSGYNALRALVASTSDAAPFFGKTLETGSHGLSIESVRTGEADMAAVDCVTLALWQRNNPALSEGIRVFGQTAPYPGLPLVTSLATSPETVAALRACLTTIATEPRFAQVRAPLLISGFSAMELADYALCLDMQALALARGLTRL